MKKIVNLVKNGNVYQVGAVTDAEITQIRSDISSISATTNANATAITSIQSDVQTISGNYATTAYVQTQLENVNLFEFVNALPASADAKTNVIYVVPAPSSATGVTNEYLEYLYNDTSHTFEEFGRFKTEVDLSAYSTTAEMNTAIANAINSSDKNWVGLQSQYDAIVTKDATVAYWIYEETT